MRKIARFQYRHAHRRVLTPLEKIHGAIPLLLATDIVLVHHKKNFRRLLLRQITESYWDHSALVVFAKNPIMGYTHDIIEESIQLGLRNAMRRGVEIHRLDKYLSRPDLYDVGIKHVHTMNPMIRHRVRSFMLMNVDTPYYRIPIADFFFAWLSKRIRKYILVRQRFSCSGLIQKAFYDASDWNNRAKLIFRQSGGTPIELQELTTPADIAKSINCQWIWNER